MADQPKPKTNKNVNDDRRNKKAFKKSGSSKTSKNPQTVLANALMGKGIVRKFRPVVGDPWVGETTFRVPFNREQREENKRLYPHLFSAQELRQAG